MHNDDFQIGLCHFSCSIVAWCFCNRVLSYLKVAPKRPNMVKKQERVKKIFDKPAMQEKMKYKVAKKRDRNCIEAIVKAGGDDSHPDIVKYCRKEAQKWIKGSFIRRKA